MSIVMMCRADEGSLTEKSACSWIAEAAVDNRTITASSRHGAAYALARKLVAAEVPDQPVSVMFANLSGEMTYPSLHAMAHRTIAESDTAPARARSFSERPTGLPRGGKNRGYSLPDASERPSRCQRPRK